MRSTSISPSSLSWLLFSSFILNFLVPSTLSSDFSHASDMFENDVFSSLLNADNVDALSQTEMDEEIGTKLMFQPASIDFDSIAIGEPQSKVISVINKHRNQSVYLGSITGNVPDFYTSYFSEKVIPPEGNATFNIVFLPRKEGEALGLLMIHTSFGLVKYEVKGKGIECPYRLTPLINLKAPLNATLSPEILMYNYHSTPLQIVEVYSSGGAFQLELPSGKQEGPQALWEIPPFTTKAVIRVKFNGKTPGNHTAYVRIKISASNDPSLMDRMLVVPIEIEIFSHTGVYSSVPFIDFGLLGITNRSLERRNISLFNSKHGESIDVRSWRVDSETTPEVVDCMKLDMQKDNKLQLELDWSKLKETEQFHGQIVIQTQSKSKLTGDKLLEEFRIPFTGRLIKGNISYNKNSVEFLMSSMQSDTDDEEDDKDSVFSSDFLDRVFTLTNNFSIPLMIINLTYLSDSTGLDRDFNKYFKLIGFTPSIVVQPNHSINLFRLSLLNNRSTLFNQLPIKFLIHLQTNLSIYEIPVHIYNGRLQRLVPLEVTAFDGQNAVDEKQINFGILPVAQLYKSLIAFVNPNPVAVTVANFRTKSPTDATYMSVMLRGCGPLIMEKLSICDVIQPGEWIVFEIAVKSLSVGSYTGKFIVQTEVNENRLEEIITPVKFTTAMGRLELNKDLLHFTDCYPGKLCFLNLSAYSTFMKKMQVEGITPEIEGITYVYATNDSEYPEISPNVVTDIGRLYFNPKELCKDDCYTSFEILSNATAAQWMSTLNNFNEFNKLDLSWLAYRQSLYTKARKLLKTISFKLTTSHVRRHEFNASVNFIWPKFLPSNINFPTLQIDQEAVKFITIANPTDHLLLVHYVLHDVKVHGKKIYTPSFVSKDCLNCTLSSGSPVFSFLNEETEVFIQDIPPHSYSKIGIRFTANESGTYSTVLYLRNNLTVVESVWITAKAVIPQFKFGNRKSGSQTPLMFEITDNHLKACDKAQTNFKPFVTIKRTFTAKNFGEVPITVYGIRIENNQCEGFGFKVLNCQPFELAPNASEKVEIEFSPDFTLSRLTRTLFLHTSVGYGVNFTLLGTVPPYALEKCNKAMIRPEWESIYRRVSASILTIAFFLVLLTAFLDSDRVLRDHLQNISRDRGPVQPPLDLRQIAATMQQESAAMNHPVLNNSTGSQHTQKQHQTNSRRKNHGKGSIKVNGENGDAKSGRYSNNVKKLHQNDEKSYNGKGNVRQRNTQNNRNHTAEQKRQAKETQAETEETSSTTTESSFNSDDSDSRSNTRSPPKSESPLNINNEPVTLGKGNKPGQSKKNVVKKSKSLPMQYEENGSANKTTERQNNDLEMDKELSLQQNADAKGSNHFEKIGTEQISLENNINEPGTLKTLGKTPGRERKPVHVKDRSNHMKQLSFKGGSSFNFDTSATKNNHVSFLPMETANIWTSGTNKASFSDVVAQQPMQSDMSHLTKQPKPVKNSVMDQQKMNPRRSGYNIPESSGMGGNNVSMGNLYGKRNMFEEKPVKDDCFTGADVLKANTNDLGPIGTLPLLSRHSPSGMQNWEPISQPPVQCPSSMQNYYMNAPARSRFLDGFQNRAQAAVSNHGMNQTQMQQEMEMTNLMQLFNADPNLLFAMFNQQQEQQQQQQQQQHQLDTPGNGNQWTPMDYSNAPAVVPPLPNNMSTATSSRLVRPPPGLSLNRDRQMHHAPYVSQPNVSHANPHPGPMNNNTDDNSEPIRTYDPFKSLSYLWQGGNDLWNPGQHNKKPE